MYYLNIKILYGYTYIAINGCILATQDICFSSTANRATMNRYS